MAISYISYIYISIVTFSFCSTKAYRKRARLQIPCRKMKIFSRGSMHQTTDFDFQGDYRKRNYQNYGYHLIVQMNGYSPFLYQRINRTSQWVNGNIYPSRASKEQNSMILLQNSSKQHSCATPYLWSKCEFHLPTVLQSSTFHSICFKKRICLSSYWKCLQFLKVEILPYVTQNPPYFPQKWKHSPLLLFYLMFRN